MEILGTLLAAAPPGDGPGVGGTIAVGFFIAFALAWFVFQVVVMLAVLRTAKATDESAHVLDLILRELRRQRGAAG